MIIEMGISVLFDFAFVNKKKQFLAFLYVAFSLIVKKYKFKICYKAVNGMENWKS